MSIEDDFVVKLAEIDFMRRCRVEHCDDRVLVAAVNITTGVTTVLDALPFEIINELCPTELCEVWSVAAFQREDGRVLVVTGDADRLIRMIMADSGEILGQWQAFRNILNDVSIAV
jgi:hypothetical protein